MVEFRLLGPLDVRVDGSPLDLRGRRQRALLVALLLRPNEVVSADRLVDELWSGSPPDTAGKVVQNAVSQLRKVLPPDVLVTQPPGYVLRVDAEQVDAHVFARRVAEGRRALAAGAPATAAAVLGEALALWRGPALSDVLDTDLALTEGARLDELRLAALEDRIEAELASGRDVELVPELEALASQHPLRERLRAHLMLALYRSGRQADALAVYARTRDAFVDELGIDPGPVLQRLERAILQQDPELERTAEAPAPAAEEPREEEAAEAEREPRDVRKTVTVVRADVGAAGAALDPEAVRAVEAEALAVATRVLEAYGARVETVPGGGVIAVFGIPRALEDDALRAVRAAVAVRDALEGANDELELHWAVRRTVRIGVETGEVVAREGAPAAEVAGAPVTTAGGLVGSARAGEILIGPGTRRLVGPAATLEEAQEGAWRVLAIDVESEAIPRRPDAPLVGREWELARLHEALDRVGRDRRSYLFTVLGPAGIGKTRLSAEFGRSVAARATVLTGRCLPYGERITFWPLFEILRDAAARPELGLAEALGASPDGPLVVNRVAAAVGLVDLPTVREETLWAARKLLEAVASRDPLVVVFEDIHWGDASLLDLIQHVADLTVAPILLLCLARPELLEEQPTWGGGKVNATTVLLEPLSERESALLIENLPAGEALAGDARTRIVAAAEGNPLFVEQLVAAAEENGADARYPPTLQALLAARVDRLTAEERTLLQHAAVIGREFARDAVADLTPDAERASVDLRLETLVRKGLVRPAPPSRLVRSDSYRFHHVLIRDVAYDSLPKAPRGDLHERYAAWLEAALGDTAREADEILGYHLEQAYRCRVELRGVDREARALGVRASARLAVAGGRSYAAGEVAAAATLLGRAADLLGPREPARVELLADLAEALRETGAYERAEEVLAELDAAAAAADDRRADAYARVIRLRVRLQRDPKLDPAEVRAEAADAIEVFEQAGDERWLGKAWELLAWAPWFRCHAAEAEEALARALVHARNAGDARTEAFGLNLTVGAAFFGPLPVAEAIARCEAILGEPNAQRRVTASALRALAGLRAMEGAFDEARATAVLSRAILEDLDLRVTAASAAETFGIIELLAGDPDAAEREFRRGYDELTAMGVQSTRAHVAALLAHAVAALGRPDEALELTEVAERVAGEADIASQVQWRAARAKVVADGGDADRLSREAVELAEQTDFPILAADAWADRAAVLRAARRGADARAALATALELYERKGNVVAARRARELLGRGA